MEINLAMQEKNNEKWRYSKCNIFGKLVAGACGGKYKRVYTKKGQERIFTESEIREFHRINEKLKRDKEKHSDPDDITRREKQNSVLNNIGLRPIS